MEIIISFKFAKFFLSPKSMFCIDSVDINFVLPEFYSHYYQPNLSPYSHEIYDANILFQVPARVWYWTEKQQGK